MKNLLASFLVLLSVAVTAQTIPPNLIYAGPAVAPAGRPLFRSMVFADLPTLLDNAFVVKDNTDPTKIFALSLGGFTAGQTRTFTPQNFSGNLLVSGGANALSANTSIDVASFNFSTAGSVNNTFTNTSSTFGFLGGNLVLNTSGFRIDLGSDANGDTYHRASGLLTRLPIGTNGQVMTVSSNLPSWQTIVGVTDGDKGDITVGSSGTSWLLDVDINKAWTGTHSFLDNSIAIIDAAAPTNDLSFAMTLTADRVATWPDLAGTVVLGSTGATDNSVLRANGTSTSLVQNSAVFIDDDGDTNFGTGVAGSQRTLLADGSAADVTMALDSKGTTTSQTQIFSGGTLGVTVDAATAKVRVGQGNVALSSRLFTVGQQTAATNTVGYITHVVHQSSGTPAAGIGTGIELATEAQADNNEVGATIESVATDVTGGAENFDILFKTMTAGAAATEKVRFKAQGNMVVPTTVTAGGTTGNQTIDKISGTVNFAGAASTLTVTNNLVTANSIVFCVVRTADATATIKSVVPGAGSFVITLGAAATAETSVGFFVVN